MRKILVIIVMFSVTTLSSQVDDTIVPGNSSNKCISQKYHTNHLMISANNNGSDHSYNKPTNVQKITNCESKILAEYLLLFLNTLLTLATKGLVCVGAMQYRQLRRTVDSSESIEAPYLIPEIIRIENRQIGDRMGPCTIYTFRNHGRTPAIIRRFQDTMRIREFLPDTEDEIWKGEMLADRPAQYIPIGPAHIPITQGQSGSIITCCLAETDLNNTEYQFLIGRVRYEDIFGKSYTQGFCFRISARPAWETGAIALEYITAGDTTYNYRREDSQS
jgi:hypothetical protein